MSVINRLSDYVSNQIAAGEVVVGPSSVVKELMENSIDAGAKLVIVNVREGGSELIQIVDDGCGMSFDDARLCFERHATSKISDINDIYSLNTYGFRGEALASIAAVAEVELLTRREGDELGTRVVIHAGDILEHSNTACAVGTQLIIKNLFYNIPARRNFLKSKKVETKQILNEFERVALSYPKVTFCLYDNDQMVYNLPESNLRSRVSNIIGKSNNNVLMELFIENQIVEIRGYIGKPDSAKKNSPHFMFVNGRYFYKSYFNKAIQLAYEKLLPPNKKILPPYILYFSIDSACIDVNVSPSKTEVKFDHEQSVFQILELAVKESLGKNGIVPMIDFEAGSPIDVPLFDGGDLKAPELEVNPYFNPFDENFSFSMAVENEDSSFRSSITDESIITTDVRTENINNFTSFVEEEFLDVAIETEEEEVYEEPSEDSFKNMIISETTPIISDNQVVESVEEVQFKDIEIQDAEGANEFVDLNTDEGAYEELDNPTEIFTNVESDSYSKTESEEYNDLDIETYDDVEVKETDEYKDLDLETEDVKETSLSDLGSTPEHIKSVVRFSDKHIIVTTSRFVLFVNVFRAAWRVLCDRLLKEMEGNNSLGCQKLLFPIEFELSASNFHSATTMKDTFFSLGFEYELLDDNRILINGVPTDSEKADVEMLFEDMLDSIEDSVGSYKKRKYEAFIARISYVTSSAKRVITNKECEYIAEQLLLSSNAKYTPNGKNIFVSIEDVDIEKMIK
ncbi:MAG: DNA mismatch repair endonuclease MutL [Rikenellaceae bacterium]